MINWIKCKLGYHQWSSTYWHEEKNAEGVVVGGGWYVECCNCKKRVAVN